jgi:hypothetical protein
VPNRLVRTDAAPIWPGQTYSDGEASAARGLKIRNSLQARPCGPAKARTRVKRTDLGPAPNRRSGAVAFRQPPVARSS